MTSIKRYASASALVLCFLFFSTQAQTPSVSTVNVTAEESNVRISAAGDVLDMRVAVSDESGDIVFESGPVAGDKLDWTMRSADGQRVPAGMYALTVTYRTPNGKLRRRVEQVLVTEEVTGGGTSAAPEDPTPQAIGTITGQGTSGKLSKFTGANAIGNSVLTESAGRIGLGTTTPSQSLHVLGATAGLRLQSTGGASLTTTDYAGNGRVWQVGVGGTTAAGGVANKFFIRDLSAGQYRLAVDLAGNVGIGTTTPTSKLTVNGGIQILGAGNGIKFADGSIQTKATAGTITGTGTTNRLAKFTGANSFGNSSVTEVSGKVGIGTASPAVAGLHIGAGVSGGQAQLRLDNSNGRNGGLNRWTNRLEMTSSDTIELSAGGISRQHLWIESTGLARFGDRLWILPDGSVGIGIDDPIGKLDVEAGPSGFHAISGNANSTGSGVSGTSPTGHGVYGSSASTSLSSTSAGVFGFNVNGGWAGYFQGPVKVTGTFDNSSDRNEKANISAVDPRSVLRKLASVPVRAWNYKAEPSSIRHLGPMAQDFRAAFGLGTDDKSISTVDIGGVSFASIQALYQMMLEKDRQIERQSSQIAEQGRQLQQLRAQLNQVRRAVKRRAARR